MRLRTLCALIEPFGFAPEPTYDLRCSDEKNPSGATRALAALENG
jgi:hypothetical protein